MLNYYLNLPKDNDNWEKVKTENAAELKLIGKLYSVDKNGQVLQFAEGLNVKKGDTLRGTFDDHKAVTVYDDKNIVVNPPMSDGEELIFERRKIAFSIKEIEMPEGQIIDESPEKYVIYSLKELQGFTEIKRIAGFVDIENITFENGQQLEAEPKEDLTVLLKNEADFGKTVISNGIKFLLNNIKKSNREAWFIQLTEMETDRGGDEICGLSPLRYFFDDDISVVDGENEKIEYKVDFGLEHENKLALKRLNGKYWDYCYPTGRTLKVKVNTSSLKKQVEAIRALKNMPVDEHRQLIKLFNDREKTRWGQSSPAYIPEWHVLTDDERSGVYEQRMFVRQAISTPDFAILEGPPGSGKTTVILEVICQLVKEGKRILLCGSTHVAIDNILERLKEKRGDSCSLLDKFEILPVRIGDSNRINDDVKEFQIDNLMNENGITDESVELLLDAANLVCGTTIGILRHPKFRKRNNNKRYEREPVIPEFDYLIIDESSKTTFQEFLVPALYAKKWVLVGDCLQLTPYTERDEIVSNLEELNVNKSLQNAVFCLHMLKDLLKNENNKFILPVSEDEIKEIEKEWELRKNDDFKGREPRYITKEYMPHIQNMNTLALTACSVIFVDKNILEFVLPVLPETHAFLRYPNWLKTRHAFEHNAFYQNKVFSFRHRGKDYIDSFEITELINGIFQEKSWAEEIAWRIEMEHQLRLVKKNRTKAAYTEQINELIPRSLKRDAVESAINMVAFMAFPSILESLVQGIKGRKSGITSTISDGFKNEDLTSRKTILTFQHRMHPEISKFPREQFYKGDGTAALQDLERPRHIRELRDWDYYGYQAAARNVWLNVTGKTERGNKNGKEADVLMEHLKKFVNWAKDNEPPENGAREWTAACLTFYRGQEKIIREKLQKYTHKEHGVSNFDIKDGKYKINIKLHTVDKFQGHEADIVFLSMVQTSRVGFMDNPNRLNVAITRSKFQLVIIGDHEYFSEKQRSSTELENLAKYTKKVEA
ncbi:MAG: DEAD/DEAH box helicase family protein [Chitinispirillia bacterium]|nr:DEAD/DEAH box helicase family protein [Chitinispirillia bacterium]